MSIKKRGLSKGLDVLLADSFDLETISEPVANSKPAAGVIEINPKNMQPGVFQPRRNFQQSELEALANSIKEQGVLQPIVVRLIADNKYEIIAGERRWRAAQIAGLDAVPVIIKNVPDQAALAIALIENVQRENLNPLEEAIAYERLAAEFGLSHDKIAQAVGKSRTTVTNLLRLLTLRSDVKTLLDNGDIDAGHAKVLLALDGPIQSVIAREVAAKSLSVRETEQLVAKALAGKNQISTSEHFSDPDIRALEQRISEKIGCPAKIIQSAKDKGKLSIKYNSLDELDGILAHILQERI